MFGGERAERKDDSGWSVGGSGQVVIWRLVSCDSKWMG